MLYYCTQRTPTHHPSYLIIFSKNLENQQKKNIKLPKSEKMEGEAKTSIPAHVLIFPFPLQGHINPMLQFSKRLAFKGLKVTLVTTQSLSKLLPPQSESSLIQIRSINDGLNDREKVDHVAYLELFQRVVPISLANLLKEYKVTSHPVKFIVYDSVITWVLELARTVGIDGAPFFTQTAAVHAIHYHVYEGALKFPFKSSLISMPSIPLLRVNEMPSLIVNPGIYPSLNDLSINQSLNFHKATLLFFNTFDKLESQVLDWMRSQWPIKTIGPAIPSMYLDKRLEDDNEYGLSFFKPETDACLQWLDARETSSVVYIAMGSLASLGAEEMEEIAKGVINTEKHFLWVVRASEEDKLPPNFKEEISGKALVVNWCPQLAVLAHRAIGCFVTHCGWNSTLEAISIGVPLVAMPQWVDQPTNAKYINDVWRNGVRLKVDEKGIVTRDELKACILEVMEGERASEIRSNVAKWKKLAQEAMDEGGSSDRNIEEFAAKLKNI
ncbi:UDP-glycosyltransferase 74E2-like isoform X1 [Chenopodium quinoa]|uniref:UDP-glycosyltransferase 74E2-like isoform X1 n=1 Tax=Chenopodium quinoa TaxID=63459 RepID=UPI000B795573|nr:UDP-glycosyltransferase 74E2-like isoform X1 [Chenopodium quinoa]